MILHKPTDIPSRVRSALRDMYCEYDASDAEGSCLAFFKKAYTKLKDSCCESAMERNAEQIVKLLLPKLQPPVVRECVKDEVEYWTHEEKGSLMFFQKFVVQASVDACKWTKRLQ